MVDNMANTDDIQIGEQIRYYRRKNGISQETLALIADLNPAYVGQIERGTKSPTINTLKKLASALGVSLATLFSPISNIELPLSEIRKHESVLRQMLYLSLIPLGKMQKQIAFPVEIQPVFDIFFHYLF